MRAVADAGAGVLPDAQSCPPGAVAARGWGLEPMDAVADDFARPAVSPPLPQQRARVAWPVQGVSDSGRCAPAGGAAVRGAQPAAGEAGQPSEGAGRRLALVEFALAGA